MPTIKRLQFANGTDVFPATDLSLESATDKLKTYVDDAAYVADNGVANPGDIYINTTLNAVRLYSGAQWWTVVIKENAIIVDDNFKLVDNGDNTKVGKFDVSNVPSGTTKTYAVPAITTSSDVLVTKDATQELKNKTIDGNLNILTNLDFGTLSGEVNPQNGGTGISNPAGATLTRTGAFDLNITCTAPSAVTMPTSGTLATLTDINTTQLTGTLAPAKGGLGTNASAFNGVVKADGAGNFSASTVTNTDVSATAAIARTKVASGTANHIVINDGTGVLSSEATLAKTRGGSGQDNTNLTFPSTGTLATLAGSESLSAKTLVEPVVDNFAAFNVETTPGTAAANTVRVYAKSDNKLYKMDSTGTEAAIGSGSGSGGINYLSDWNDATKPIGTVSTVAANGNITVSGSATPVLTSAWYADATSGAAAIAASATTALRGSSNYLTALSGASTSGATFVQSAAFQVDASDLGKPVTISFDLTGVTTDDDWDVVVARYSTTGAAGTGTFVELIPVAGNVSSTTGTPGAKLPTSTTQFKGFFIASATANDVYSLRFRRRAGSTQIRIDSLAIGPQSLAQGAVVTAWQSYTPTGSWSTATTYTGQWRRVGTNIELMVGISLSGAPSAGTLTLTANQLLNGLNLTYDNTKSPTGITKQAYGIWNATDAGVADYTGWMYPDSSANANPSFALLYSNGTATSSAAISQTSPFTWGSGDNIGIKMTLPISQWSSGTTTLADRAVEEYSSWNSTGAGTGSVVSGVSGGAIPTDTPSGTFEVFTITSGFSTSILQTDSFVLEFQLSSGGNWQRVGNSDIEQLRLDSSNNYIGAAVEAIGSNGIRIIRGKYRAGTNTAWSGISGYKWRVRKVSSGAAVGFPVSARNIVGDTSGTAVPTGMVGEVVNGSSIASTTIIGTSSTAISSITLTPGRWEIKYNLVAYVATGSAQGNRTYAYYRLRDSTDTTTIVGSVKIFGLKNSGTAAFDSYTCISANVIVDISQNTTYLLRALRVDTNGTGSATVENGGGTDSSNFYAIRIA